MTENTNTSNSKDIITTTSGDEQLEEKSNEDKSDNISDLPAGRQGIKNAEIQTEPTNIYSKDRMLLVLSAPSIDNDYYKPAFQQIIDFQINYAKAIM
jgi:hypothetical protein